MQLYASENLSPFTTRLCYMTYYCGEKKYHCLVGIGLRYIRSLFEHQFFSGPKNRASQGFTMKRTIQCFAIEFIALSKRPVHQFRWHVCNHTAFFADLKAFSDKDLMQLYCALQIYIPYARHYNPLLIRNHSWIQTIHKTKGHSTLMNFKKWVKSIQAAGYNGARTAKLYIPSTLNIGLTLWHTQLIVCAENVKSWFKSWVSPFTFQAYILLHTLNCMCDSLFKFHIWILEQF